MVEWVEHTMKEGNLEEATHSMRMQLGVGPQMWQKQNSIDLQT